MKGNNCHCGEISGEFQPSGSIVSMRSECTRQSHHVATDGCISHLLCRFISSILDFSATTSTQANLTSLFTVLTDECAAVGCEAPHSITRVRKNHQRVKMYKNPSTAFRLMLLFYRDRFSRHPSAHVCSSLSVFV